MTKGMENTMADTKLFNIKGAVKEYQSGTVTLEKELQTVIENNMNICDILEGGEKAFAKRKNKYNIKG